MLKGSQRLVRAMHNLLFIFSPGLQVWMCVQLLLSVRAGAALVYPHLNRTTAAEFACVLTLHFRYVRVRVHLCMCMHVLKYFTLFYTAGQTQIIRAIASPSLKGGVLGLEWLGEEFQAPLASCLSYL